MDQYIGLPIRLVMKNKTSIEGTVLSIDIQTQSLILKQARYKVTDRSPWKSTDKIVAKGEDIADLQILKKEGSESQPVIQKKNVMSAEDVERNLRTIQPTLPNSKKQQISIDPAIIQTTKKPISQNNSIVGCLDEDFKRLDLDSLSYQTVITPKKESLNQSSPWSKTDVKTFKQQGDFDFQASLQQFDKKKHYEEFKGKLESKKGKTTLAAINKPVSFIDTNESSVVTKPTQVNTTTITKKKASHIQTESGDSLPYISSSILNKTILYSTNKWGPNTVQLIENASRSIIELITRLEFKNNTANVLLLIEAHKIGAIGLALGRHLINRGYQNVIALIPDDNNIDHSDTSQDKSTKAYIFQRDIGSRHGVKMISKESDFMNEISSQNNKGIKFNLIIDAMTGYDEASNPRVLSDKFSKWMNMISKDATIISIHHRTKLFSQFNSHLVMLALPFLIDDKDIYGRTFIIDVGLSPSLWMKFITNEPGSFIGKEHTSEALSRLYQSNSYVEVFYKKQMINGKAIHAHNS